MQSYLFTKIQSYIQIEVRNMSNFSFNKLRLLGTCFYDRGLYVIETFPNGSTVWGGFYIEHMEIMQRLMRRKVEVEIIANLSKPVFAPASLQERLLTHSHFALILGFQYNECVNPIPKSESEKVLGDDLGKAKHLSLVPHYCYG